MFDRRRYDGYFDRHEHRCRQAIPAIPNPNFDQGNAAPAGWTLSGGQGRWLERHILEVTGVGDDNNQWSCEYHFLPGSLYRFQVHARRTGGNGGFAVTGPSFADHNQLVSSDWRWYSHVFRPPTMRQPIACDGAVVLKGSNQFDAVRLTPVLPVPRAVGPLRLGEGESIHAGRYTFAGVFGHEGSNYHRPLLSATADFNSDRYCFSGNQQVTYCFHFRGIRSAGARWDSTSAITPTAAAWRKSAETRRRGSGLRHATAWALPRPSCRPTCYRPTALSAFAALGLEQQFPGQPHRVFCRSRQPAAGCPRPDGVCRNRRREW